MGNVVKFEPKPKRPVNPQNLTPEEQMACELAQKLGSMFSEEEKEVIRKAFEDED